MHARTAEPRVAADVLRAVPKGAQPPRQIGREQLGDQVARLARHVPRVVDLAREDVLVERHAVLRVERRVSDEHLVDEDTARPPVDRLAVSLVEDDLRREVLGSTAQRPCLDGRVDPLGKAEISHLHVAEVVEEEVLGLQVSEDDVLVVQMLKREDDGRSEEPS